MPQRNKRNGGDEPNEPQCSLIPLRDKVRQALLLIVDDPAASAAAKASACRTLLDFFASDRGRDDKRASEMTLSELDAEIARHST